MVSTSAPSAVMAVNRALPVLTSLREPAALLDGEGRLVAANPQFGELGGGDNLRSWGLAGEHDERLAALSQGVREVLAGRSPAFTYEYERGDPPRSFELVVRPYRDEALSGALLVHYETTDHKRALAAERRAQERLEFVTDLMPDGYWDWDIPSGRCYLSPRWCESLGYSQDELPPHIDSWGKLLHPDDRERVHAALQAYWARGAGGGVYQAESRLRCKDGSYRWILDQGRVLSWSADGKAVRMVGVDINVHARKLAELTVQEQARRILEMSIPLIPIRDDVVVMPLIGAIDGPRAQQILGSLLAGLSERKARVAILDITGVSEMDTHVASVLVRAARAVQLLGARIVLTGVRPEVATILVQLDIQWGGIVVRGTLQSGIAYATGGEHS